MTIGNIINYYGEKYTPYVGGSLINHLPMGQFAIYRLTNDLESVRNFTSHFLERSNIHKTRDTYPAINSIKEAVGNRKMYESYLALVRKDLEKRDIEEYAKTILNKYGFGLSSGLFHTIIRFAYAVEGYRLDPLLSKELERSLAYYVTAYRKADLFTRRIDASLIKEEMQELVNDKDIKTILGKQETLGKKIKALYSEKDFMDRGFVIDGGAEEKIDGLLELLIPTYYFSGNIVVLHCITGLHAIIVLKDYFDDYEKTLDILTTSIITHLLTIKYHKYIRSIDNFTQLSWDAIQSVASDEIDVHAVKLAYSAKQLDRLFKKQGLKDIVIKRVRH